MIPYYFEPVCLAPLDILDRPSHSRVFIEHPKQCPFPMPTKTSAVSIRYAKVNLHSVLNECRKESWYGYRHYSISVGKAKHKEDRITQTNSSDYQVLENSSPRLSKFQGAF